MQRKMLSIWMMVLASLLFALMGMFVKLASEYYSTGEIVFYRSLIGLVIMVGIAHLQSGTLATKYQKSHFVRSFFGAGALCLWFYSIGQLPLATAMTLNYTASVWMAVFVIGNGFLFGRNNFNKLQLIAVLIGFIGVVVILQPTLQEKQWLSGFTGLLSGVMSAIAFLQISTLGKLGEPGYRVVFYFSLAGVALGLAMIAFTGGFVYHTAKGACILISMGLLAAGAQWATTYAFSNGKPLINASLQYMTIAFSCVCGILMFGDNITLFAILGMILIIASGILSTSIKNDDHENESPSALRKHIEGNRLVPPSN
jgi:drug/metabolite transporter (DMT)-like permease